MSVEEKEKSVYKKARASEELGRQETSITYNSGFPWPSAIRLVHTARLRWLVRPYSSLLLPWHAYQPSISPSGKFYCLAIAQAQIHCQPQNPENIRYGEYFNPPGANHQACIFRIINNMITDFNSHREYQIKGIPFKSASRKVGDGNKDNMIHYKRIGQKIFKCIRLQLRE
jgi:hypothetical protein